jgi:hypothetical protein
MSSRGMKLFQLDPEARPTSSLDLLELTERVEGCGTLARATRRLSRLIHSLPEAAYRQNIDAYGPKL